ncbi:hypothetical protein D915_008550 [Fasciola hepatica]|uniref:BPTI/Kunitz inhibitor domain-containing protein n=1 Tax=Fasciola hepatica TaxID=6192 RepID=A0A4E0RUB6_FASHE|nr:hypothetical protein D915_008550 [Fasciola hepatica]
MSNSQFNMYALDIAIIAFSVTTLLSSTAVVGQSPDCYELRDSGPCEALMPRFYWNQTEKHCKVFDYGGCQGTKNNFKTMKECHQKCHCKQPILVGECRARLISYGWNDETQKCELFFYRGCGGNTNRFFTKERCRAKCGQK